MTKKEIINLIKSEKLNYENHARLEQRWIDTRTNPTSREIAESKDFTKIMRERAYALDLLLERIEMEEGK